MGVKCELHSKSSLFRTNAEIYVVLHTKPKYICFLYSIFFTYEFLMIIYNSNVVCMLITCFYEFGIFPKINGPKQMKNIWKGYFFSVKVLLSHIIFQFCQDLQSLIVLRLVVTPSSSSLHLLYVILSNCCDHCRSEASLINIYKMFLEDHLLLSVLLFVLLLILPHKFSIGYWSISIALLLQLRICLLHSVIR